MQSWQENTKYRTQDRDVNDASSRGVLITESLKKWPSLDRHSWKWIQELLLKWMRPADFRSGSVLSEGRFSFPWVGKREKKMKRVRNQIWWLSCHKRHPKSLQQMLPILQNKVERSVSWQGLAKCVFFGICQVDSPNGSWVRQCYIHL